MKISIVGAGAVGGYLGGKLALAQNDVTFIARGRVLEAMQKNGLRIKSPLGDFQVQSPRVTSDIGQVSNSDIILICVKSYNTIDIAKSIKPFISDNTIIISVQNGIDNENRLSEIIGAEKIIGSVIYIVCDCPEPGLVNHISHESLLLGEINGEITPRLQEIEKLFTKSNISVILSPNIQRELWKKIMLNIAYNGFTTVLKRPLRSLFSIPEGLECYYNVLKEIQTTAKAEGYIITDEEVNETFRISQLPVVTDAKSSTLQDLEAGKALEIEYLQGAVVKTAKKHNIQIPICTMLYSILKTLYPQNTVN